MTMPLSGLRILDLGRVFAAPWCTQLLADMGADVVKVERPDTGDIFRQYAPPYLSDHAGRKTTESGQFHMVNRNKRSITVDFTKPEGRRLVIELARKSDIFVENYKVGDLARYGLDYASMAPLVDKLIYCSITGFGQTGPYAERPATDSVFQAMSGLMSVTGEPDQPPQKVGVVIIDLITGLYAASAIQAAVRHREINGGKGQHIDLSLLDVGIASMAQRAIEYLVDGTVPQRLGSATLGSTPAQVFECLEGQISVQAGGDREFRALCDLLDLPGIKADPRYACRFDRTREKATLLPPIVTAFRRRTAIDWYERLVAANIICAPIYTIDQTFDDPQVRHRELRRDMPHSIGPVPTIANPIVFSETPITDYRAAPLLGEHTDAVLAELLGMDDDRIARLRAEGVV